jgi:hypothetical protein
MVICYLAPLTIDDKSPRSSAGTRNAGHLRGRHKSEHPYVCESDFYLSTFFGVLLGSDYSRVLED